MRYHYYCKTGHTTYSYLGNTRTEQDHQHIKTLIRRCIQTFDGIDPKNNERYNKAMSQLIGHYDISIESLDEAIRHRRVIYYIQGTHKDFIDEKEIDINAKTFDIYP